MQNLSKIGQETKKLQKMGNDVICDVTSKNSSAIFVCEYFLLLPIDVPSFKLIEGQIKELQGVVPNTPRAENDQKKPGQDRVKPWFYSAISNHFAFLLWTKLYYVNSSIKESVESYQLSPALRLDAKTAKTNTDKAQAQLFAESVERHFGIQSNNIDSNHFDEVDQFIEDNYEYFYPPEDPDDYRSDMDDDHDLVADIDSDTLIKIVKFLKRGKAPGPDNIHNEVLRLGTTTLFHHLARLFTSSIQIGYIPTAWKLATIRMLLKPNKLPSLTTTYRPISLMSSIMKLFERMIEQRLRSYLEDIGFINKYQSGFRQNKSTDDHLFRLSQSVMESFNRREQVVAAFLDVEKAFDNVWHNGLRYKIFMLDLPTKMTRWLSDFLVGRVIQVNVKTVRRET